MAVGGAPNTPPNGPPPSAIQTHVPEISFQPSSIPPFNPVYLQQNDLIAFFAYSNTANVNVQCQYRYMTPKGEVKEGLFNFSTNVSPSYYTLPLGECFLISFALRTNANFTLGSWVFVQVAVSRGFTYNAAQNFFSMIWQGYVGNFTWDGFPGTPSKQILDGPGTLISITGSTPAAGTDISETIPSQRRRILLALKANLTTSAVVANRNPVITLDDGANIFFNGTSYQNQPASTTLFYSTFAGLTSIIGLSGATVLNCPQPIQLKNNFRIRTSTSGIQAGDQWTAPQYLVLEWGAWDS